MKKFFRIFSLLSLAVVFTAISANAQTSSGGEVNIPFAFSVGQKSLDAGSYKVKVNKLESGAAILSLENTKTERTEAVFLSENGVQTSSETKLGFDTVNGQKYLSPVSTPYRTFAIVDARAKKDRPAGAGWSTGAEAAGGMSNLY